MNPWRTNFIFATLAAICGAVLTFFLLLMFGWADASAGFGFFPIPSTVGFLFYPICVAVFLFFFCLFIAAPIRTWVKVLVIIGVFSVVVFLGQRNLSPTTINRYAVPWQKIL